MVSLDIDLITNQLSKATRIRNGWSCLSTSEMMDIVVPPLEITREIIIRADGNGAGQKAADKLAESLDKAGYGVRIEPSPQGQDFNDVLRGQDEY